MVPYFLFNIFLKWWKTHTFTLDLSVRSAKWLQLFFTVWLQVRIKILLSLTFTTLNHFLEYITYKAFWHSTSHLFYEMVLTAATSQKLSDCLGLQNLTCTPTCLNVIYAQHPLPLSIPSLYLFLIKYAMIGGYDTCLRSHCCYAYIALHNFILFLCDYKICSIALFVIMIFYRPYIII